VKFDSLPLTSDTQKLLAMVYETDLLSFDGRVSAPEGIVYSTSPRRAEGEDGHSYFIKGPDVEVVFAELAGCSFATRVKRNSNHPEPHLGFGSDHSMNL
jgi:hypothetical protein